MLQHQALLDIKFERVVSLFVEEAACSIYNIYNRIFGKDENNTLFLVLKEMTLWISATTLL